MPEPDRLSLVERARLVEIAHASTVPEIMMAALDVLKAAAIVSAMELYPQVLVDDEPAPLTSAEDAPHA
jgi:hypothetical protein